MDFSQFDQIDSRDATIAMARIESAITEDMSAQGRKFVKTEYSRWVDAAYGLSNKSSLRYGASIGRKIIRGETLKKTDAMVRGSDLAKVVYFTLHMEGHRPWVSVKNALEELGLNELARVQPIAAMPSVAATVKDGVQRMDFTSATIAAELIALAKRISPLESQRDQLASKVRTQNLTIVNQSNQIAERDELLRDMSIAINRLKAGINSETDEGKKINMTKFLEEMLKKFDKIS